MDASIPNNEYMNILKNEIKYDPSVDWLIKLDAPHRSNKQLLVFYTFELAIQTIIQSGIKNGQEAFNKVKDMWLSGKPYSKF